MPRNIHALEVGTFWPEVSQEHTALLQGQLSRHTGKVSAWDSSDATGYGPVMQKNAGCWKDTEYRIKKGNVTKDVISFKPVLLGSALKSKRF